jgi:hypothetical protein
LAIFVFPLGILLSVHSRAKVEGNSAAEPVMYQGVINNIIILPGHLRLIGA